MSPSRKHTPAGDTRRAYLHAIKRIHPDKLGAGAGSTQRIAAAAVFEALRQAHEEEAAFVTASELCGAYAAV